MTLTDRIRECKDGVIDNPYQGTSKKVLFVCSAGILRSATAARIYAKKYNTRCCGSMRGVALIELTERMMDWADQIVFVKQENFNQAAQYYDMEAYRDKCRILAIPDEYPHMDPQLINHFEEQYETI